MATAKKADAATEQVEGHESAEHDVTENILEDAEIRQGIKEYFDWPTIPQVYLKGEFLGGSDILIEMYNSGSLKEKIEIELAS